MSFFSARHKKGKVEKKKWQQSSDEEEEEDIKTETGTVSLDCADCDDGNAEPDVYCIPCKLYLCCKHFEKRHPLDGEGDVQQESELSAHEFRILVGVSRYKIDALPVGWVTGASQSQFSNEKITRAARKRKQEEELRELDKKVEAAAVAALLNPKASKEDLFDYIDDADVSPPPSQPADVELSGSEKPTKKLKRQIDPVTGLMSLRPVEVEALDKN